MVAAYKFAIKSKKLDFRHPRDNTSEKRLVLCTRLRNICRKIQNITDQENIQVSLEYILTKYYKTKKL